MKIIVKIGGVAREHQDALLSALNREERETLGALLIRIADQQGLTRGEHRHHPEVTSPTRWCLHRP